MISWSLLPHFHFDYISLISHYKRDRLVVKAFRSHPSFQISISIQSSWVSQKNKKKSKLPNNIMIILRYLQNVENICHSECHFLGRPDFSIGKTKAIMVNHVCSTSLQCIDSVIWSGNLFLLFSIL